MVEIGSFKNAGLCVLVFFIVLSMRHQCVDTFSIAPGVVKYKQIHAHSKYHRESQQFQLDVKEARVESFKILGRQIRRYSTSNNEFNDWNTGAIAVSTAGQATLIGVAVAAGKFFKCPPLINASFGYTSLVRGAVAIIPLLLFGYLLKLIFGRAKWYLENEKSIQETCKILFGIQKNYFKIVLGSLLISLAAGFGEEMLFRGVIQRALSDFKGDIVGLSVASIIFGALHFVTPAYAIQSIIAGFYFGAVFMFSGNNIAVPIVAHTLYDVVAIVYNQAQMLKKNMK